MVPDKFNMVDMGGIDLIMAQGEEIPGLYMRLVESIAQCRYQCLYNWFFDGIVIPPTYVIMEVNDDDEVVINEGVIVTDDDVIHIYSIERPPEIIPLLAEENGAYNPPAGKDGFNPVMVNVPSYTPVIESITITANGIYNVPAGVDGYSPIVVNVEGGDALEDLFVSPNAGGTPITDVVLYDDVTNFSTIFVESAFNHTSGIYCILTSMTDPVISSTRFFANNAGAAYHNFYISGLRSLATYNMAGGNWYIKHVFGIRKES